MMPVRIGNRILGRAAQVSAAAFILVALTGSIYFLVLSGCSAPEPRGGSPPAVAVRYEVKIRDPGVRPAEVKAVISNICAEEKELHLKMTGQYAFVRLDEPLLQGEIEAHDIRGAALPLTRTGPYGWTVETLGGREVRLGYSVPLLHRDLPEVRKGSDEYEQPYLEEDHGMLVAGTLFIVPAGRTLHPIRVSFDLPPGWKALCPWDPVEANAFSPGSGRELFNDLAAIGEWSVTSLNAGGMDIMLAFAPGQEALEEVASPLIEKIVRNELALFGTVPCPRYLFLFVKPVTPGFGGSPKTGSMVLSINLGKGGKPRTEMLPHLAHLIAHEFHHLWSFSRYDCPDELRFFNEGFTDYYSYLIQAREGIISLEGFEQVLESRMAGCESSPLRGEVSLADAGGDLFFNDRNAYDLVYEGGLLIAALLDAHIRRIAPGKNLDFFMRAFNNDPRWSTGTSTTCGRAPKLGDFLECVEAHVSAGETERFVELINKPFVPDFLEEFQRAGVVLHRTSQPAKPDLRGNLDRVTLLDLDKGGPAYRIGVRAKDRFLEVNGIRPENAADVYRAWSKPRSGRISVVLGRGSETITIDQPLPENIVYSIDLGPWRFISGNDGD